MSLVNVAAVLTNPRFMSKFCVHRRKQKNNPFGEPTMEVEVIDGVQGVVHPESANDLMRRSETQIETKSIVIYTRFALRGESQSCADSFQYQPDLVKFQGNFFVVIRVEDWSNYARGFVKALATSQNIVDQPPGAKPLTETNPPVSSA